uniref:EF-hand domain-containing protein n=1 Tax=Mola mola TaxID=94237 RepID=A0A3Q4ASP8_MOLML
MAGWGRVVAGLRNILKSRPLVKSLALRRAVGPGALGCVIGTGVICYYQYHANNWTLPYAVYAEENKSREAAPPQLSARKIRFNQFASVMYKQEPYMTPRDFLFSVMLENVDRKMLLCDTQSVYVDEMRSSQKAAQKNFNTAGVFTSSRCVNNFASNYTLLIFSLLLIEPHTGFDIAFKMLDVDGNEHVDKKEFLKVLEERVNTTLQAYFFGKNGENKLQYQEFRRFMEDLQAEVHEMEFLQFSKGMDTMRREDFAEWLLHYTSEEDNETYRENMRKRIPAGQSITFDEFKAFCLFTNNLEDFAFSVKLMIQFSLVLIEAQFKRAVKIATGHDLSENVLDTVFKLFDMDGDDYLSHKEFINVMKDRVLRGLKVQHQSGLSGYWKCVKRETLKGAQEALGGTGCPF